MKSLLDIHVVLATPQDMEFWEDQAEAAADRLNDLLHMLYGCSADSVPVQRLEKQIQHIWETWREDEYLLDIDEQDLRDWVDQLLATWDDENFITSEPQ